MHKPNIRGQASGLLTNCSRAHGGMVKLQGMIRADLARDIVAAISEQYFAQLLAVHLPLFFPTRSGSLHIQYRFCTAGAVLNLPIQDLAHLHIIRETSPFNH
jgi:hypothetical protein